MQKITPHLWFDKEAKEAADFYISIFEKSKIKDRRTLRNTPSGSVDIVDLEIYGQDFTFISAGPFFKLSPAISFLIACQSKQEVEELWERLIDGGSALMEIGEYPFSDRYGWLKDKYGVSWQIMFMGDRPIKQKIIPTLMFVGEICGRSEEAIRFYSSIFKDTKIGDIMRYGKDDKPDKEGTIKHASFILEGQEFAAMDSAHNHDFAFNESISFVVHCDTQEEIDYYWKKLSADPAAEQCGWLKDKYGLSWQIVPDIMEEMLRKGSREKIDRVTEAFLKMKKFDIERLKKAYDQDQ